MSLKSIPREHLYTAIRVLSLCALFFASMLAVDYYMSANTFCHEGASCEVVAKSEFGQKYGIFLPTLGLVAYSFFFLTSFFFAKTKWKVFGLSARSFWVPLAIICCAVGALLFIVVQAIEINAFCWLCMGIDTSAIAMVVPAVLLMLRHREDAEFEPRPTNLHPVIWAALYVAIVGAPLAWGMYKPPIIDTSSAAATSDEFQRMIDEKVPEYIRSKYVPGKINVYEISSFGCPFCRKLHPELSALLAEYGGDVNFVRSSLPIHMSQDACAAYYCANKMGKGDQFAECMFEEPPTDAQSIVNHGNQCDIPQDEFIACIQSDEAQQFVRTDIEKIRECGFKGAPTVWIDAQMIEGYNPQTVYRQAIEMNPVARHRAQQAPATDDQPSALTSTPILFKANLTIAALLLIAGIMLQLRRRKNTDDTTVAGDDSTNDGDQNQDVPTHEEAGA